MQHFWVNRLKVTISSFIFEKKRLQQIWKFMPQCQFCSLCHRKNQTRQRKSQNVQRRDGKIEYLLPREHSLSQYYKENIGSMARQYKQNKKASIREKYRVAQALLERLRRILEDVSHIFTIKQANTGPK